MLSLLTNILALGVRGSYVVSDQSHPSIIRRLLPEEKELTPLEPMPFYEEITLTDDQLCVICLDKEKNNEGLSISWTEEEWSVMVRDGVELLFPDCHGCDLCSECLIKICDAKLPCPVCKRPMQAVDPIPNMHPERREVRETAPQYQSSQRVGRDRPRSRSRTSWRWKNWFNFSGAQRRQSQPRRGRYGYPPPPRRQIHTGCPLFSCLFCAQEDG